MKVLHYVGAFSLPSETFIYDLISNLEVCDIDNYVLTHRRELLSERPFSKVKVISENNIVIKLLKKTFCRWNIFNKNKVIKYINELKPDVIHAHFGPNGVKIYQILNKIDYNSRVIVSFHGMDVNVLPQRYRKYRQKILDMSKSENIFFTSPSQFLKNKMLDIGFRENKVKVIPNAYNPIFTSFTQRRFWENGEELKLLNIGRFEEVKGQKYLLKALALICKYYPKTTLSLVGYGSMYNELQEITKMNKISDHVYFLGKIEHIKVPDIIKKHDIYIQPSIVASDGAEESLSVSTIEAQISGLPAIVSHIGGLKEVVIDNVTGKLVEEKNVHQLYQAIKTYIDNSELLKEHSASAIQNAKRRFDKKNITKNIIQYYKT